jgi:RNA polymerase sigma factor (sigma-70 family)
VARRLPASFELDDLISAGNLGLMAAATKYDPAKRSQTRNTLAVMPFESYARPRIRGAILDSVRRGRYTDHTMAGLDEAPERTVAAVIDISIDRERRVAKMRASVAALPDRLRDTINVAYSKGEPDLRQIAKVLEIGASHASHLKSQALAKLRDDPTLREVKRA